MTSPAWNGCELWNRQFFWVLFYTPKLRQRDAHQPSLSALVAAKRAAPCAPDATHPEITGVVRANGVFFLAAAALLLQRQVAATPVTITVVRPAIPRLYP